MAPSWIDEARHRLRRLGHKPGIWAYQPGKSPAVEPTALAALALAAADPETSRASGRWLAAIQKNDGSLGVSDQLLEPGWPTPFALLLWAAMNSHQPERTSAARWLVSAKGTANPRVANEPMGHDLSLIGWAWNAGTHSWVEPTALALLALNREGKSDHPRAIQGRALLIDRAIPGGGWNMGNPVVFGAVLRPIPGPTGLALLALAALRSPRKQVEPSIAYLRDALASTNAPVSLGWGLLGLDAWGARPDDADARLQGAYARSLGRPANAVDLAMFVLAAEASSMELLGLGNSRRGADHE